jgi:hypothetical protein
MPGLLVVTYRSVKNPEAWKAYAKVAVPAIERAGGRFLARSNPTKVYESGMNERVVLVALLKAPPDRVSPIGERIALVGGRGLALCVEENLCEGHEE